MARLLSMPLPYRKALEEALSIAYGPRAPEALSLLDAAIERRLPRLRAAGFAAGDPSSAVGFTERDALLIAYGDMIAPDGNAGAASRAEGDSALARLGSFLDRRMPGLYSYLHILPFYPYSSDDGFSVMDYRTVDPALGSWADVEALGLKRRLAFDLVLNHASAKGSWFAAFKAGRSPYDRFFVTRGLDYDSSTVLRPRVHPLITPVRLDDGRTAGVWTTFSDDQADLDFGEPAVLAEFADIILEYALHGARMLRLDAIAYLWKRDGTSCAHLPETHAVVKAIRALVDGLRLGMVVLTETNVPHAENMSYFGDGDEAHMVYNFSLPPLTLHAFVTEDAGPLSRWAAALRVPAGGTMLNFLASHDGVGVTPALGLVDDFGATIAAVAERGGLVSYKASPSGPAPYELNVSWADAVARPEADDEERSGAVVASYAIACAMDGVPAVYFHSAVGSRNWAEGPARLGHKRAVNRERPRLGELEAALDEPGSLRARALSGISALLVERGKRPAFAPGSPRTAYESTGSVFLAERGEGSSAVLVAVNCSREAAALRLPPAWAGATEAFDPVRGRRSPLDADSGTVAVPGYGVLWMER